jgi:hypothetical protein
MNDAQIGVSNTEGTGYLGNTADSWGIISSNGNRIHSASQSAYGNAFTTNDIIMVALDMDSGKWWAGENNVWHNSGSPVSGTNEAYSGLTGNIGIAIGSNSTGGDVFANFGQDSSFAGNKTAQGKQDGGGIGDFYYTPPSGFLALCTKNLPDPAVIPAEHFQTAIYPGTGSSQSINLQDFAANGTSTFQPDFVWIKSRSNGGSGHRQHDSIRGTYALSSASTTYEFDTGSAGLTSFDTDGITVGTDGDYNGSVDTYVAWNWKANGTGVSNTNGSINSTVSANADAGFSIVSYTGTGANATVGHGLASTPEMVIVKNRNYVSNWPVLHSGIASDYETDYIPLNNATPAFDNVAYWNDTKPTNSLFSVGTDNDVNRSGDAHIAYCFHSVDGYSKVGSYTGNGSADGTFVYTGFRPAFILYKHTAVAENWWIHDSERAGYNPDNWSLPPNSSQTEVTGAYGPFLDIVSNGFKCISTDGRLNSNGVTYIYIAFAESPFKHTNAR